MSYRIGIDLGGTKISAGIIGEDYRILAKKSTPTGAERTSGEIIADIAALCTELAKSAGVLCRDAECIGIATPGAVDQERGVIEYACNLPFRSFPVAEELAKLTGAGRVCLANDANAAALGEAVAGAARGTKSSVMVTLGTGVGGGVILDGKILTGINGAAGELGHMVIEATGELCPCGRRGCFEAYSSATALKKMTREAVSRAISLGIPTLMTQAAGGDPERCDTRTAFDAAKLGDAEAQRVVDRFVFYLACGITNIINIFQPEVISIGGGLSGEKDYLLAPLLPLTELERYTRTLGGAQTVLRIAELGNDAGIIGAAAL